MYEAAPPPPMQPQPGQVGRPPSMDMAVRLMQAGGVLALLSLILVFFQQDQIREMAEESLRDSGQSLDSSTLDAAVTLAITFGIVFGLLGAGLWFWMAYANGKGKKWARIVATVFYAISLLSFLFGFTQPTPILSRILSILTILVGTGAVVMMYRPESTQYYNGMSAPRY